MKITKRFFKKHKACKSGYEWYLSQENTDCIFLYKKLVKENRWQWANWLIKRKLNRKQKKQYSVYVAKFGLPIFEKKYLNDDQPRKAIKAAIKCIKNDTKENRNATYADYNISFNTSTNTTINVLIYKIVIYNIAVDVVYDIEISNTDIIKKILNYGIKLLKGSIK